MVGLRAVVTAVFSSMVFYGIVMMLLPKGTMNASFKTLAGIAVIASIVVSVGSVNFSDFEFNVDVSGVASEYSENLNERILNAEQLAAKTAVENIIEERLNSAEISFNSIEAFTDISENGGISIIKAEVVCERACLEDAKTAVGDLGINVVYKEGK